MYKIHQFVFDDGESLFNENNILGDKVPVVKLGIQGQPNVSFSINGGNNIILGQYGIYELDLSGIGQIISLKFNGGSVSDKNILIVDIVYEEVSAL